MTYNATCEPQDDNVFGPIISANCRQGGDFTLLFEQSILSILPTAVFLLIIPFRLANLYKTSLKTRPSWLREAKAITAVVSFILQLALLILWRSHQSLKSRASIPSTALASTAALLTLFLSYVEHAYAVQPSFILNVYLLLSIICDIPQTRTLYIREAGALATVFVAAISSRVLLLILEAQNKRSLLIPPYDALPVESTSGIFNRSFSWWLNSLFARAFRHLLGFQDLSQLDPDLDAERWTAKLQEAWDRREVRFNLAFTTGKAFMKPILFIVFPRLCLMAFSLAQPFLINRVLTMLTLPSNQIVRDEVYVLIAATGLVYLGIAFSNAHFQHNMYRFITIFRGAAIGMIYGKSLQLQSNVYDATSALTLISANVDTICQCFVDVNSLWASALQLIIAVAILAMQLRWVCIMPLLMVAFASIGNTRVTQLINQKLTIWLEAIQERVTITGSVLSAMQSVRILGLTSWATTYIHSKRVRETERQAGYRWMRVWLNIIAETPTILSPIITFATYAVQAKLRGSDTLSIAQAFSSLSVISLMTTPAEDLLGAVPAAASSLSCFERVQAFLLAPDRMDVRKIESQIPSSNTSFSSSTQQIELRAINLPSDTRNSHEITIKNLILRPNPSADIVISNLNLTVKQGSIQIIIGPAGSGKTTLLRALLGEILPDSGLISVTSTNISYCAQSPWLYNGSIRENICGFDDGFPSVDDDWYKTVLWACVLEKDISQFPNGDSTVVGSKAVTLSGGQKQRIALARAIYAKHAIFVLDDIFSAVDASTERIMSARLLGEEGIFRRLGSTVVLVTHAMSRLSFADQITALHADGSLAKRGTYKELRHQITVSDPSNTEKDYENHGAQLPGMVVSSEMDEMAAEAEAQIDDLTRRTGDMAVYIYYLKRVGWIKGLVFTGLTAIAVFANSFSQAWLNWWLEAGGDATGKYLAVYIGLGLVQVICQGASYWAILVLITPHVSRELHLTLLSTVMRASQDFFSKTDSGITLNRFSQDMTLIEGPLALGVLFTVFNAFLAVSQLGLVASSSSYMSLVIPPLLFSIYILQHVYLRTSRQLRLLDLEAKSPIYSSFLETLDGLVTLRAFGWQKRFKDINMDRLNSSQKPYYLLYCVQRWLTLVLDLIVAAMGVLIVALALNSRSSISAGLLGIALNNILVFNTTLQTLVTGWTQLETSLGAVARVRSFEAETETEDKPSENVEPPITWPDKGEIVFKGVTASYNQSRQPALSNITFNIPSGRKVGICGRTGSGKSTTLAALLRLIEISDGDILIDSLSLLSLPRSTVRSRLLAVPQESVVLPGSIRLNIDPWNDASDAEIISALTKVNLWPNPLFSRGGLDMALHENPLSAGQMQLFALARAILRRDSSCVLLLDEATSNLDADQDRMVQAVLREEFEAHTILCVAHRLDTILDADQIIVMDRGRILETGQPLELLKDPQSKFTILYGG